MKSSKEFQNITSMLQAWSKGDHEAGEKLSELLTDELKEMIRRKLRDWPRAGQQTTEFLSDLYIRLIGTKVEWESRRQLYKICSNLMRQILVDQYRMNHAQKRGDGYSEKAFESWMVSNEDNVERVNLIDLDQALIEFETMDPLRAQVVELRFFGGFSVEETAKILGVSEPTVKRYWKTAKNFLKKRLTQ